MIKLSSIKKSLRHKIYWLSKIDIREVAFDTEANNYRLRWIKMPCRVVRISQSGAILQYVDDRKQSHSVSENDLSFYKKVEQRLSYLFYMKHRDEVFRARGIE